MKITGITALFGRNPLHRADSQRDGGQLSCPDADDIQVQTDEGIAGLGECGYNPLATFTGTPQAQAFEGPISALAVGENPFDSRVAAAQTALCA